MWKMFPLTHTWQSLCPFPDFLCQSCHVPDLIKDNYKKRFYKYSQKDIYKSDYCKAMQGIFNSKFLIISFSFPFILPASGLSSFPKSDLITMDTTSNFSQVLCHLIVMMLTLGHGVYAMPVPTDVPMCTASETAQYSLTFTGKWTQAAFPKQYPVYRPPAQWSNLIGKSQQAGVELLLYRLSEADVEQYSVNL